MLNTDITIYLREFMWREVIKHNQSSYFKYNGTHFDKLMFFYTLVKDGAKMDLKRARWGRTFFGTTY